MRPKSTTPGRHFKLKKITKWKELEKQKTLETSDLALETTDGLFQYEYVNGEDGAVFKHEIPSGISTLIYQPGGVALSPVVANGKDKENILKSLTNTEQLINEANSFFTNLDIYEKLEQPKKRSALLIGPPGCSKSTSIKLTVEKLLKEDKNTAVIIWPTGGIEAEHVADFFKNRSKYAKNVSRFIFIAEDIGGHVEGHSAPRGVNPGLLNLLEGADFTFEKPTFIIATSNYPEMLAESLADRPGRFDMVIELNPPTLEQKIQLLEFIAKRKLTKEEKDIFKVKQKDTKDFSVAHIKEIVIRSMLHKKSIAKVVEELIEHKEKFKKGFKKGSSQFGI